MYLFLQLEKKVESEQKQFEVITERVKKEVMIFEVFQFIMNNCSLYNEILYGTSFVQCVICTSLPLYSVLTTNHPPPVQCVDSTSLPCTVC